MHTAVQLPGGRAIDRYGARAMGFASLAAIVAGNGIALADRSFWVALAGRAVMGLGTGTGFVAGSDYVRSVGGSPTRQGIYGGASIAGAGLALAIVPQLGGWRAPYLSALAIAVAVALVLAVAPPLPRTARSRPLSILRDRRLLRLGLLHSSSFGLGIVAGNWVVTLLEHGGHGHRVAALAGALTLLAGLVTRPLGGMLSRPWRAVPVSLVGGAIGCALLATPSPLPVLALGALLVGLAAGMPFAPVFTGAAQLRADAPAAAVGVANGVANLAILVGTPLVGLTFSLPGDGRIGFALLGVASLAGLLLLRHQ